MAMLIPVVTVTVKLKPSQWFGDCWMFLFKDNVTKSNCQTVKFTYSYDCPEKIMAEIRSALNLYQIEELKINF